MPSDPDLRRINHEIAECPHCGERHVFSVLVRLRGQPVMLFGGPGGPSLLAFTCPRTKKVISAAVPDPPNAEIVGPAEDDRTVPELESEPASETATLPSAAEQEYADWIKASRATAIDFCKTMLTAATGAVPVYFAVLKYLGADAVGGSWFSRVGAVPPLLFLAAAIVLALALRPRLGWIQETDFASFRTRRLRQLNRDILVGLALFSSGILLAIFLSVAALWR